MNAPPPIYLDHNATTPPSPGVVREMLRVLEQDWGNPSSMHAQGQAARRVLIESRAAVAETLGCSPAELVFTSGATEANHQAVLGALQARSAQGRGQWVLSAIEHPGLQALADRLRSQGVAVSRVAVDSQGQADLEHARSLIGPETAVVSLMGANNETGVIQPVAQMAALCRAAGAWLHVDATQWLGKDAVDFKSLDVDLMSVAAHKLHGPKGVGALRVRKGLDLPALMPGRQERRRRGGTENLPGIAGFGVACLELRASLAEDLARMTLLRQRLEQGLLQALPKARLLGAGAPRLVNTSCLMFDELDAEPVLSRLERAGVLASSGAACGAGGTDPSHVLLAMGMAPRLARCGIRFSLGRNTTDPQLDQALGAIVRSVQHLLDDQPVLENT
ncbi:MAG: cysteine desulfurase [Rubrivivax sp.]|nr:cysteine desulfurase [Rubrivivax sp.]